MSWLHAFFNQTATRWPTQGLDLYGQPQFGAPSLINCRWEEKQQFISTAEGFDTLSRAQVFVAIDIPIGDYLFLGNAIGVTDPRTHAGAARVLEFRKIPDLMADEFERRAFL